MRTRQTGGDGRRMIQRRAPGWQLILADLALILFLVTLTGLVEQNDGTVPVATSDRLSNLPEIAPSQALFRPDPLGPSLAEWLSSQPADPRTTLTIFASHSGDDKAAIWEQAEALASSVAGEGFAVRVVITRAAASDLYASLAFDAPDGGEANVLP